MDDRLRTVERQAQERGDAQVWRDYATALVRVGRRDEALVAALHARALDPSGRRHDLLADLDADVEEWLAELRSAPLDLDRVRRVAAERPLTVFRVLQLLSDGPRTDHALARDIAEAFSTARGLVQTYLGFEHAVAHEGIHADSTAGPRIGHVTASAARVAAALATAQPRETLRRALAIAAQRPELHDLLACLIQEMVLRGASLVDDPAAAELARTHPIAGVATLYLRPIEAAAPQLVVERPGWGSFATQPVTRVVGRCDPIEVPPALVSEMALFCAQNANSRSALWAGRLATPPPRITPETLAALDIECLRELRELELTRLTGEQLYDQLLGLFLTGSVYYGCGWFGAQARGLAWRTLSWLVGEWGQPVDPIESALRGVDAVRFTAGAPWFDPYEDRLGLAVLRPDGSLAVFAIVATD